LHKDHDAINRELNAGAAQREVARRHGLSKSCVARHSLLHLSADGSPEPDVTRQLLDSAQRALRRAEARGKHRDVMEALKILAEVRKRHQIASVSVSQQPQQHKHDVTWLCEQLKQIYGVRGNPEEREDKHQSRRDAHLQQV
jgi:hypothetical protein